MKKPMIESLDMKTFEARHGRCLDAAPMRQSLLFFLLSQIRASAAVAGAAAAGAAAAGDTKFWSCGDGAACALLHQGKLVLGDLDRAACGAITQRALAEGLRRLGGPEAAVRLAVAQCAWAGIGFSKPMPVRTMVLEAPPVQRVAPGHGRLATTADLDLIADWLAAFKTEALPDEPALPREALRAHCRQLIEAKNFALWEADGAPVSMAAIVRDLPQTGAISMVYTAPERRARGFAGAVVGLLAARILESGRPASLFVDARNPVSTRCYEKIGFTPVARHADAVRLAEG